MPNVHTKLSASGAIKWLNCSGSIALEAQIPQDEREYLKEEKNAHALGEAKIRLKMKKFTSVKYHKIINELDITEDMEKYTHQYSDFVIERFNAAKEMTPDAILLLEQKIDFSKWVVGGLEICNAVIIAEGMTEIIDFNYSNAEGVEAENNPQLMLYAVGILTEFDYLFSIKNVTMTIFQPCMNNISSCQMAGDELLEWADTEVIPKAKKANSGTLEFCAGKHCNDGFCKARPICRAYANENLKIAAYNFKQPAFLSIDEIGIILKLADSLLKWVALIKDYALDQAVNYGVTYSGYKVVEGRSNRTWNADEKTIAAHLIGKGYSDDDIWPRKLKSITAIEQLLSKKIFKEILEDFVVKPKGKPTLAAFDDKRSEINLTENPN
ncbi:MAG TPA: DUF2800 domain-containing protein [Lachnospiraceae bacterium]|nr:DUF2800 domain-containing protein [Lachnospiraceae bacterium]